MAVDHETLLGWLTRLKLTAIRDQLDNLLDEAAEKKLTLREALAMLVEREVSRKDERRIEMALKIARFPMVRELCWPPSGNVGYDQLVISCSSQ